MENYRWACPDGGPVSDPLKLAQWAAETATLAGAGAIYCAPCDLPALTRAMPAARISVPKTGHVQPGTVWITVGGA